METRTIKESSNYDKNRGETGCDLPLQGQEVRELTMEGDYTKTY
ncbi:MAG: hypothetical protein ABI237_15895 [Ginsengibacter sp.]